MDLIKLLPDAEVIEIVLHDHNYNRSQLRFGTANLFILKLFQILFYPFIALLIQIKYCQYTYEHLSRKILNRIIKIDQTAHPDVLAQTQCILKKKAILTGI
jgi:hypothetical protein